MELIGQNHPRALLWIQCGYVKSAHHWEGLQPEALRALFSQAPDARPSDVRDEPVPIVSSSSCVGLWGAPQLLPTVP